MEGSCCDEFGGRHRKANEQVPKIKARSFGHEGVIEAAYLWSKRNS